MISELVFKNIISCENLRWTQFYASTPLWFLQDLNGAQDGMFASVSMTFSFKKNDKGYYSAPTR